MKESITTDHSTNHTSPTKGKRSAQVSLVLLGSMALWGCDRTDTYQYANEQDCVKDWGEDECQRNGERGHGGMFFFYASAARHQANKAQHAQSVKRGGFGSRFSSGRS